MGKSLIRQLLKKQSDQSLHCLPRPFWQAIIVQNYRTATVNNIERAVTAVRKNFYQLPLILAALLHIDPINEPRHDISNNLVCATSKGSDQPAHTRSLIRAFAGRLNIL